MKYKKDDDNRYRVNFMRDTEKLMDDMTVKQFISYLEENAEFEDNDNMYLNGRVVDTKVYCLHETEKLSKEFIVTADGRVFYWLSLIQKIELIEDEIKEEKARNSMKTIRITYDTRVDENDEKITGETCMDIIVMEEVADNLIKTGQSGLAIAEIEKILKSVERLKGRMYLRGSIKDIREA